MIGNSLKNFFGNLVYLFIPMGIFYLFLLVTIFTLFGSAASELGRMLSSLSELIHLSAEQSSASVNDFLSYAFGRLDWNGGLIRVVRQILSTGWIGETAKGFFETLNASTEGFEEQFTAIVAGAKDALKMQLAWAVAVCALGLMLANYATRFAVRRKTARRGLKKFLIAHTLVPIAQNVLVFAALLFFALLRLYSLPLFVALALFSAALSLVTAWLIHRDRGLKLRDVVTVQNIFRHLASLGVILLIDLCAAVLLYLFSPIFAVLLMIPVALYSMNIADVNAESYICELVGRAAQAPEEAQREIASAE